MRWLVLPVTLLACLAAAGQASAAVYFHSPSRNIRCVIAATALARCDITHRDWTPPPKPRNCPGDWANGMQVALQGSGRFTCVNDAVPAGRKLAYGESIRRGPFRCTSRRRGMRCVNVRNGHGFALSRSRARGF
jgi:hypothetical protein